MSVKRERAVAAQTKLHTAQRLIVDAAAELQAILPRGCKLVDEVADLLVNAKRVELLTAQTLKRIP